MFDLERCGRDLGVAEEIHEKLAVEVADANGFGHTLAYELLHSGPRLLDRGVTGDDILAIVGEAGRVALRGIDVFEGDGEVDDVEVEVVDAPVFKLLFANRLDSVVVVEGVPEFGDKEEIGTFDYAFFNGARHALAGFRFVAVITCTIKETVARFDSIVDSIGAGVVVDFPKPGQKISMLSGR